MGAPVAAPSPAKTKVAPVAAAVVADASDLPKATVKLQAPVGAAPGGPRPASVPAPKAATPKATVPLAKGSNLGREVPEAVGAGASPASFELEGLEDSSEAPSVGRMDKWLAIAASIVALLSTVSTFLAYSVLK
ncbi:MAG: hypothetical protein DVB28_001987 [Verrucomicrobia bacterium]|nr:MAG: hypothetical protein DVB28_001987 [Verrucomicrobiota bacterium]